MTNTNGTARFQNLVIASLLSLVFTILCGFGYYLNSEMKDLDNKKLDKEVYANYQIKDRQYLDSQFKMVMREMETTQRMIQGNRQ